MKAEHSCGRCYGYAHNVVTYTHPTTGARHVERACPTHTTALTDAADRLGIADMAVSAIHPDFLPLAARAEEHAA